MFRPDIKQLEEFYASNRGKVFERGIKEKIRKAWPEIFDSTNHVNEQVLGVGFVGPYLDIFLPRVKRLMAAMPPAQGATQWPGESTAKNLSLLAKDSQLPFADNSISKLLVVHGLEFTPNIKVFMRELWRVLDLGGKILIVAPNRTGIWARSPKTPLGYGQPFSKIQMKSLLEDNMFVAKKMDIGIFTPPLDFKVMLKNRRLIEKLASCSVNSCGGVIIAEGEKEVYALRPSEKGQRTQKLIVVPN